MVIDHFNLLCNLLKRTPDTSCFPSVHANGRSVFAFNSEKQMYLIRKKELIQELFQKFEDACIDLDGLECWSIRELQVILDYKDWRTSTNTIQKTAKVCQNAGEEEKTIWLMSPKWSN